MSNTHGVLWVVESDCDIIYMIRGQCDLNKICIWYPFECDMGLDGTLTSHIERVEDEFDMACQSAI